MQRLVRRGGRFTWIIKDRAGRFDSGKVALAVLGGTNDSCQQRVTRFSQILTGKSDQIGGPIESPEIASTAVCWRVAVTERWSCRLGKTARRFGL